MNCSNFSIVKVFQCSRSATDPILFFYKTNQWSFSSQCTIKSSNENIFRVTVWGIHRSPVNSPHKGQWRGYLIFFICAWTNSWANNGDSEDLRHHRAHYGVTVMGFCLNFGVWLVPYLTHIVYFVLSHYTDVIMSSIASQITSLTIVYSAVYSGADQRKHQSSASLVFVLGIHRGPVNSPHKRPVTRKMFPFDDVIMAWPCVYDMDTLYVLLLNSRFLAAAILQTLVAI